MNQDMKDKLKQQNSPKHLENPKDIRRKISVRDESASYKRTKMEVLKDIDLSIDREILTESQINCVDSFVIYATLQDIKMKYRGLTQEDIDVFLELEKDQDLVDNFTDEYPEYFA